jgi:hypothetical protein
MIDIGRRYEDHRQGKNTDDSEEKIYDDLKNKFLKNLHIDIKCIC